MYYSKQDLKTWPHGKFVWIWNWKKKKNVWDLVLFHTNEIVSRVEKRYKPYANCYKFASVGLCSEICKFKCSMMYNGMNASLSLWSCMRPCWSFPLPFAQQRCWILKSDWDRKCWLVCNNCNSGKPNHRFILMSVLISYCFFSNN